MPDTIDDFEIASQLADRFPGFGWKKIRKVERELKFAFLPRKIEGKWIWLRRYVVDVEYRIVVEEPAFRPFSSNWVEENTYVRTKNLRYSLQHESGTLSFSEPSGGELSDPKEKK